MKPVGEEKCPSSAAEEDLRKILLQGAGLPCLKAVRCVSKQIIVSMKEGGGG